MVEVSALLTLLAGWQEGHLANINTHATYSPSSESAQ